MKINSVKYINVYKKSPAFGEVYLDSLETQKRMNAVAANKEKTKEFGSVLLALCKKSVDDCVEISCQNGGISVKKVDSQTKECIELLSKNDNDILEGLKEAVKKLTENE